MSKASGDVANFIRRNKRHTCTMRKIAVILSKLGKGGYQQS